MAKTKSKSKSKFDFKGFLLKRGEYLAMGIAGFFLFLLMVWGVSKWSSAKDPDKITKDLTQKSQAVQTQINNPNATDADRELSKVPEWAMAGYRFTNAPVRDFLLTVPQFDPTAKPDTKKENPNVLAIGAYQVDLIRGGMPGVDIVEGQGGDRLIAVIYNKTIDPQDQTKANNIIKNAKRYGQTTKKKGPPKGNLPPGGFRPPGGGFFPPGGGMGPPGGGMGPGGGDLSSPGGSGSGSGNPYGGGGGFNFNSQRVEKAIQYVPISQLDAALKKQMSPAMTVIPVRMITVHAEVPLKKQIEEIRRALRLPDTAEAARWGPFYEGFNVRRRVSAMGPDGKLELRQDWADYDFEEQYRIRINSLREEDHFDNEYLGNFIRYEMALALPLPKLVEETGAKYPDIRLKNILDTIKKLQDANKGKVDPSETVKRVSGGTTRGDLYKPQTGQGTGASEMFGMEGGPKMGGGDNTAPMGAGGISLLAPPKTGMGSGNPFKPMDQNNPNLTAPVEIENLLLRFVDANVSPGDTYEYQIQLILRNPNYKRTKEVSKPIDAEQEFLTSPWVKLADAITIPNETFLYAADWGAYTKRIKEEYDGPKDREMRNRLEAKEYQAVLETVTWMEEVRTGDGGKREPVGTWVVADYPVGRGEYIGRKQYVKLPLWSSENKAYSLRELPDKMAPKAGSTKGTFHPRGWLMDFTSNKSILIDFEGGKVRTRAGNRDTVDEVATEMLILRGDGKLVVKSSVDAEADDRHNKIVSNWQKWLKEVAARKDKSDDASGFSPRNPGGGGNPP
jgi:hypothetical protein